MSTCKDREVSKPIRVIAAACNDMGIGKDGQVGVGWSKNQKHHLHSRTRLAYPKPFLREEDPKGLKRCPFDTIQGKKNLMIWGRDTWFSFPESLHPITNGIHVVLSHTLRYIAHVYIQISAVPEHAHHLCHDFDRAVQLASCGPISDQVETIWVNGGAEVYREALGHPWCDLVYLTDIMARFHCDTFFPQFDRSVFRLQDRFPGVLHEMQEENGIQYKFQVFKRDA